MGLDWGRAAAGFAIGASTSYAKSMEDQREWERQMRRDEVNDKRAQHFESLRADRDNEWKEEAATTSSDRSITAAEVKNENVMDAANLLHKNKESRAISASGRALRNSKSLSDYNYTEGQKREVEEAEAYREKIEEGPLNEKHKQAAILYHALTGNEGTPEQLNKFVGNGGSDLTDAVKMKLNDKSDSAGKGAVASLQERYDMMDKKEKRKFGKLTDDKLKKVYDAAYSNTEEFILQKLKGSKDGGGVYDTMTKEEGALDKNPPPKTDLDKGGGKITDNVKEPGDSKGSVKITPEEATAKKESSALWSRWKRGEVSEEELNTKVGTGINLSGWKKKEKAESNKRVRNMVKAIESGKQSNEVFKFAASEEEIARVKEKLGYQ